MDLRAFGRVLVVEDDEPLARTLVRVVRPIAEPVVAGTVREAIAHVTDDEGCRAAILDLSLPDGSGLDVLAHARRSGRWMPAMVLTGRLDPAASNAAFDMGALYVVKPVVSERIERFIQEAGPTPPRMAFRAEDKHGIDETDPPSVASRLLTTMADAAVAELHAQYDVGLAVHRLRYPASGEPQRVYGMTVLGKRLGLDPSALRRRARVTEIIGPSEFAELVQFRSTRGMPLTWSHMEVLATIRNRPRREAIARQMVEGQLGIRECTALVRAAALSSREPDSQ